MAFINNVTQFSFSAAMVFAGGTSGYFFFYISTEKKNYIHNTFPSRSFKKNYFSRTFLYMFKYI